MSWERWRDEIAKAMDGSHHTIEGLEQAIRERRAEVWMTPDACLVTEVQTYEGGAKACQVMWGAGSIASCKAALTELERIAKAAGCSEMLIEGHAGWARALRDLDYRPWSVTVKKALT